MSRFAPRPLTLSATLLVALTLGCHSRPETTASPGESSVPETARGEAPEAVEPPAMTQLEYKQCGEAAAAAYNESVDGAGADHLLEAARCFEGAGHGGDGDRVARDTKAQQLGGTRGQQPLADVEVEAAHDNADAEAAAVQVGFDFTDVFVAGHGVS